MAVHTEKFLVDADGERIGVVLDMDEYRRLLAEAEELASIRAYDEAKQAGGEVLPLEDAIREIESEGA